jgi:chromosome partitioning protein
MLRNEQRTFSVGEAAEQLGVSPSWLRLGEKLGSLPRAQRTPGGHRRYTMQDVEELRRAGVGQRKETLAERGNV